MASQETEQQTQGSSSADTDQPPLWRYVTKLEKQGVSGGCRSFGVYNLHQQLSILDFL